MNKITAALLALVIILLAGDIFFGVRYFSAAAAARAARAELSAQKTNAKILDFTKLFIDKVLKAETEVDFETRLRLENAVRDLNDAEIMTRWTSFVESQTEAGAQKEVKNLLSALVNKIEIK